MAVGATQPPQLPTRYDEFVFASDEPLGVALADDEDTGAIFVHEVEAGSQAEELGVPEGSELVAVNGTSVEGATCTDAKALIVAAGRPLVLRVRMHLDFF